VHHIQVLVEVLGLLALDPGVPQQVLGLVEAVGVLGDAEVGDAGLLGLLDELLEPLDGVGAALDQDEDGGDKV
jgi:hypothetical protein